jgi:uncharacterized membrane protein (DUF373 family)
MSLRDEFVLARGRWLSLGLYQRFEHAVILVLTGLIAIVIVTAVWSLTVKIIASLLLTQTFDPTDHVVFQSVFGMIFTVIIALEFKRSLLVVRERKSTVVQVRVVVLLAMLAIVRKVIILDLTVTQAPQLLALAAAILSLGVVHWLVRDKERDTTRRRADPD